MWGTFSQTWSNPSLENLTRFVWISSKLSWFSICPHAQCPGDSIWFWFRLGEKDPVCSNKARSSAFHNSQERLHVLTRWQNLDRANYQTQMTILLRIGIWRASRVDAIRVSISVQASWSLRSLLTASFTTMAMMSGEIISTVSLCIDLNDRLSPDYHDHHKLSKIWTGVFSFIFVKMYQTRVSFVLRNNSNKTVKRIK